jgi:hypothetical protein
MCPVRAACVSVFIVAGLATVMTACGGGGSHYAAGPTAACLGEFAVVETSQAELDYVAQDASEGALEARIGEQSVTISFERTVSDAQRTFAAYEAFGSGFDQPTEDILQRQSNAVLAWTKSPTEEERSAVIGCLRERGDDTAARTSLRPRPVRLPEYIR